MPYAIPDIDLSSFTVGSTFILDISQVQGSQGVPYSLRANPVTCRLYNESSLGLQATFDNSAQSFYIPAGGWIDTYPKSGDTKLTFLVKYGISNPGVSSLLATYYYPGDQVPAMPILGNSATQGNVNTVSNTLVNTGNPPLTPNVIKIQPSDASSPTWIADNSGNLTISGDNAGTLTQLFKLIAGASPEVILAALNILTLVQGSLQVNGIIGMNTTPTSSNELEVVSNLDASRAILAVGHSSTQSANILEVQSSSGTTLFDVEPNGNVDVSATIECNDFRAGGSGNFLRQTNHFNGTGSGTFNHGLGTTPKIVIPMTHVSGSQTMGYDSENATQVHITAGAGLAWVAEAINWTF